MPKAYSYMRFSTAEQKHGDSLRRQTKGAERYAAANGLELDDTLRISDEGKSGYYGENKALGAFLEEVKKNNVPRGSVLIVEALDRLSRQDPMKVVATIIYPLLEQGIDIVTLYPTPKRYTYDSNPSTAANLMQFLEIVILATAAHDESVRKALRGRANWQQKRIQAIAEPLTAKLPAWCRMVKGASGKRKIELIPVRAEIVRDIFKDYLAGIGQVTIAKNLNIAKVPCWGKAQMWYTSYISKILTSPSVMGVYVPHLLVGGKGGERIKQEPIYGYFPAVVSEADYNKVQSMKNIGCFKGQKQEVHNIFSNLAKCPLCNSTMRHFRNGVRSRAKLICTKAKAGGGCMGYSVDLQELETAFIQGVPSIRFSVTSPKKQQQAITDLQSTIDRHKQQLANIMQAIQSGQQTPDADIFAGSQTVPVTMLQAVQFLENKIEEEEKELNRLHQALALVRRDTVRERLGELKTLAAAADINRAAINAALQALCSHVVIDYVHNVLVLHLRVGATVEMPVTMANEAVQSKAMMFITGQLAVSEVI